MKAQLTAEISRNVGIEEHHVRYVIDEFLLQLHRRLYEYVGMNGDYIGEELHYQIGPQGVYHLLSFLDIFSERYSWEQGSANEYLHRIRSLAEWSPYRHQTESWVKSSRDPSSEDSV